MEHFEERLKDYVELDEFINNRAAKLIPLLYGQDYSWIDGKDIRDGSIEFKLVRAERYEKDYHFELILPMAFFSSSDEDFSNSIEILENSAKQAKEKAEIEQAKREKEQKNKRIKDLESQLKQLKKQQNQ